MPYEQPMANASPASDSAAAASATTVSARVRLDRGEHAELVAAHPVGVADPVDGVRQALAEAGQQRVARWMAERVVVLLEAVEIEEREHDAALAAGVHQRRVEVVDQRAAVGEPRQRVGAGLLVTGGGHSRVLAGQAFGDGASERGTSVEEHERQCEEKDRDCGACRGA